MALIVNILLALSSGLLLAWSFPLTLPPLNLPGLTAPLTLSLPGTVPGGGYAQLPWLAFLALVPLLFAAQRSRTGGQAFLWGWLAGLVWRGLGLLWFNSFGVLPVVMSTLWCAIPLGLFTALARIMLQRQRAGLAVWGLAALWTAIEYVFSFGFWAFPWALLAHTQVRNLLLLQSASLGGVYFVSFLVTLSNTALFTLLATAQGPARRRLGHACLAGALLALALAYGALMLNAPPDDGRNLPQLKLALVQGGLGSRERWNEELFQKAVDTYCNATETVLQRWATESEVRWAESTYTGGDGFPHLLVVWPESVLPRKMDQRHLDRVPSPVWDLLDHREHVGVLLGTLGEPEEDERYENGLLLLTGTAKARWARSKVRLVPFGEVLPFRGVLKFLDYPWGDHDICEGRSRNPVEWAGVKLGAGVCFDNVFGFIWRAQVLRGAEVLVVSTNNSWYDLQSGIRQHCDMDALRAVECGRTLARVSTTGWSHIVSPTGRVLNETGINQAGLIEAWVTPRQGLTLYMILGDLWAQLCTILSVLAVLGLLLIPRIEFTL